MQCVVDNVFDLGVFKVTDKYLLKLKEIAPVLYNKKFKGVYYY